VTIEIPTETFNRKLNNSFLVICSACVRQPSLQSVSHLGSVVFFSKYGFRKGVESNALLASCWVFVDVFSATTLSRHADRSCDAAGQPSAAGRHGAT